MKCKLLIFRYLFIILIGFGLFTNTAYAQFTPSIWDVLRRQFTLNHEERRPEVQTQIRWIVSHPTYLKRLAQSEPYIYHIVSEIRKRRLPGEIALIPLIESAYDPFAYSGAGAAGLWQLMPGTGTDLGLKRDWWHDGRRSIRPSTDAALNYLAYLNKFFSGNWLLAFAAYDSGEGTVSRLIKKSGQRRQADFWRLPLPRETRNYIPRLLALAAIIQNPQRYHVQLPEIPHVPYFEEVNVGSQIDLNHAAKLAGISYKELIKLNPEYNRWTTAPYHPYKLLIPVDKVRTFYHKLSQLPHEERVNWRRHKVASGENLSLIAKRHHTTANLIKELNQLKSNAVKVGQYLLIPSTTPIPTAPTSTPSAEKKSTPINFAELKQYKIIHIAQKKESYADIAKRYGVTEENIKKWNLIGPHVPLHAGHQLVIWKEQKSNGPNRYTIVKGDNLSRIAKRFSTKVSALMKLNPHLNKHALKPGQEIILR
ncbi:lytic transglycosylase [Legionella impletisoli]|uniref:Lytic transglycosylase n=1 Tax=Legionella impletisoli TaxID=343510 RepID=A0A917N9H4_9GAMM|nr:lytic transglycosylase [Legionella impletisoli]